MLLYLTSVPRHCNVNTNDVYVSRRNRRRNIRYSTLPAGSRKYRIRITTDENANRVLSNNAQRYFLKEDLTLDISFVAFAS